MNTEGLCEKELKRRLKQKITLQYITYSSFKIGVVLSRAYTPAEAQQSPRIRILNHT